jgi:ketosteroid isomerase-like protein
MSDPAPVARAYFAAITAHDADAVAACFADDAVLVTVAGTFEGPAAIAGFYRDNAFQFEDLRPTPGPFVVDGDQLAVEIDLFMGGRHTPVADFFTVDGATIRRLVIYMGPPST